MMAKPEHIERLGSGLTLIHRHMPDTDSVTVQISFGAGGRYEDLSTEYGVSHFLEHLLFKGSQKYPTAKIISEKIDGVGGYMNAYTTEEMTSYYIKVPQQHFELALDVLADITLHPLFDPTEIDRERGVILEEMNVYLDDPGQHVFDLVGGLLWPEDPLRTNVIGTAEIIRHLPREVIAGYHAALYTLDNAIVSVAGNVPLARVEQAIEAGFSSATPARARQAVPTRGPLSQRRTHVYSQETNQSHLVLSGRAIPLRHPDEPAFRVLTSLLGSGMSSRLFMSVREEKGLAYTIFMRASGYTDAGKWEIYGGINNDNLERALDAIMQELRLVRAEEVDESELAKVKEQLKGRIIMSQETNGAVADRLGSEYLLTGEIRPIEQILDDIDAVTTRDLLSVAQRYLDPTSMRLAMISPVDAKRLVDIEHILYTKSEGE
ncbi:MAG: pitrilysin family protein [Candidatus Saccharibacteria bacterium]